MATELKWKLAILPLPAKQSELLAKPVKLPSKKKICRKVDYKLFPVKVLVTENSHTLHRLQQ